MIAARPADLISGILISSASALAVVLFWQFGAALGSSRFEHNEIRKNVYFAAVLLYEVLTLKVFLLPFLSSCLGTPVIFRHSYLAVCSNSGYAVQKSYSSTKWGRVHLRQASTKTRRVVWVNRQRGSSSGRSPVSSAMQAEGGRQGGILQGEGTTWS